MVSLFGEHKKGWLVLLRYFYVLEDADEAVGGPWERDGILLSVALDLFDDVSGSSPDDDVDFHADARLNNENLSKI